MIQKQRLFLEKPCGREDIGTAKITKSFHGKDWEVLKPRLEKSNNSDFWISKISRNRERDDEINKELLFLGWTVIRFWGNEIKKDTDACIRVIEETIFDEKMRACEEHDQTKRRGLEANMTNFF